MRVTWMSSLALLALTGVACLSQGGCPATAGSPFLFNLAPTPVISADLMRGVAPLRVQFDSDRSTDDGVIISRVWDFGDGSPTSQEIAPVHIFAATGEYSVTLTLTDNSGASASRTLLVSVTEAPVPVLAVDRTTSETAPAVFNFDASASFDPDGEIESFRWNFGDGSSELVATVSHQYSTPGIYRVVLTVTDDTGVTADAEQLIAVGIPQPEISVRVPPSAVENMLISRDAPLWIQALFEVEPGVPYSLQAGVDGDQDVCDAKSVLFDRVSGVLLREMARQSNLVIDIVTDAVFSPDGDALFTSGGNGLILRHSPTTGAIVSSINAGAEITSIAVSPSGLQIVYGLATGEVVLRNVADGALVRTFVGHTDRVTDVAFSPLGDQILSGSEDRHALLWKLSDGTILRDFLHPAAVNGVAFSPADQTTVATACSDFNIRLFNTTGGNTLNTLIGHTASVNAIIFSSDGFALFSASDDRTARAWSPFLGTLVVTYTGHTDAVLALAVTPDGAQLMTGSADGTARVWNSVAGTIARTLTPCQSPIVAVSLADDTRTLALGVAARNSQLLDTNALDGVLVNDLNIAVPTGLDVSRLAAGSFFVFAQIDTNQTSPVRTYANAAITLADDYAENLDTDVPPTIPADSVDVVVDESAGRQIVDLGRLERGDRLTVRFLAMPGFSESSTALNDYGVTIVDAGRSVFAAYTQRAAIPNSGIFSNLLKFIRNPIQNFFTADARLVIGHTSNNYYLIIDGAIAATAPAQRAGHSLRVEIERGFGFSQTQRPQRFLVDFRGGMNLSAGIHPPITIPQFTAAGINSAWNSTDTLTLKSGILSQLTSAYSGFNITFVSSDNVTFDAQGNPLDLASPFQTIFVGGTSSPAYPDGNFEDLLGIADFVDPRNETSAGRAIVFANTVWNRAQLGEFTNSVNTPAELGAALGRVAANVAGQMLGLRLTDDAGDVMEGGDLAIGDPTISRTLGGAAPLSAAEQIISPTDFPVIGLQNSPQLLSELVGP